MKYGIVSEPKDSSNFQDGHLWHFWIKPIGPALCYMYGDNRAKSLGCPLHPSKLHLTVEKTLVTCQECLELIHS